MKKRVYISGPMSGIPDGNTAAFRDAEFKLKQLGFIPVNPLDVAPDGMPPSTVPTYFDYMKADIKALLTCDMIYMLPFWELSKGAALEKHIADFFGMEEYHD